MESSKTVGAFTVLYERDLVGGSGVGELGQAEAVARRVPEPGVDAVGPLLGRFGELDAERAQLLVALLAVVGLEEVGGAEPLGHDLAQLLGGVVVHHRRSGDR